MTCGWLSQVRTGEVSVNGIGVGDPGTVTVYVDAYVAKDSVVSLSQVGPGLIAGLPSTAIIRTQSNYVQLSLVGMTAGTGTLTATSGATVRTTPFTIAP